MNANNMTTKPLRGVATVLQDGKPVARFAGSFSFAAEQPAAPAPAPACVSLSIRSPGAAALLAALREPLTLYVAPPKKTPRARSTK